MTHCCLVNLQIGTQYNKGGEHQSTIMKGDTKESAGHHDQRRSPRGEAQVSQSVRLDIIDPSTRFEVYLSFMLIRQRGGYKSSKPPFMVNTRATVRRARQTNKAHH